MGTLDINNLQGEFRTGTMQDDGVFVTPVARLSYPSLFERSQFKSKSGQVSGEPTFNATLIFNTQNPNQPGLIDITTFWGLVQKFAENYFASNQKSMPFDFPLNITDGRKKDGKEGYGPGYWYISAKNYNKQISHVPVVDGQLNQLNASQIKGGDFVRARIDWYIPKSYEHKGISYGLKSIQLVTPWEAFGGAAADTGKEWSPVPTSAQVPAPSVDW